MKKIQNSFSKYSQLQLIIFIVSPLFLLATSCTHPESKTSKTTPSVSYSPGSALLQSPDEISVMAFNVENLFDNIHDENTEDYPYLPLSKKDSAEVTEFCKTVKSKYYRQECYNKDWNDDVVRFKLSQVAATIKYINNGLGPDIILMSEVENNRILNKLADEHLQDLGYRTRVLIEGPDVRGIDPAILSKFPLKGKPILHVIPYQDEDPEKLKYAQRSRGIIEATLILPNKKELTVMSLHFPSQSNPTEWRFQAINFLRQKMQDYAAKGRAVIAGGDMNTTATEDGRYGYFTKTLSQAGQISHLVGCQTCEGSHNYKGEWSFLDVIAFGHAIDKAQLKLIPESIQILKTPENTSPQGTPLRFDEEQKVGVADHFPLYARLKILKSKN